MKLSNETIKKIEKQMTSVPDRGNIWVRIRPVVFEEGKFNKKTSRADSKKICREYENL